MYYIVHVQDPLEFKNRNIAQLTDTIRRDFQAKSLAILSGTLTYMAVLINGTIDVQGPIR